MGVTYKREREQSIEAGSPTGPKIQWGTVAFLSPEQPKIGRIDWNRPEQMYI
jgi:hypothetical protein